MRIAIVHSFYSSAQPSGENIVVGDQIKALQNHGHEVRLVSRLTDKEQQTRLYSGKSAIRTSVGYGATPATELTEFGPDVVHLHNTFPNWGTSWLREWGPRTVATLHNYRTVCAAGTLFRGGQECVECLQVRALPAMFHRCYRDSIVATAPLALGTIMPSGLRRILTTPSALVTLNHQMKSVLEAAAGRNDIHVVPNFVPRPPSVLRKPDRGWLFVGRITAEKGLAELLKRWPQSEPIDIIGDGELRKELSEGYSRRPEIKFLGSRDRENVTGEMDRYQGLVVPSLCREGLPTVILEALAQGLPSILSSTIAAAPSLINLGAALKLPEGGPAEIATTLRELLDPSFRQAALRVHAQFYSPSSWLDRMEDIYEQVIHRAQST